MRLFWTIAKLAVGVVNLAVLIYVAQISRHTVFADAQEAHVWIPELMKSDQCFQF
ncbi:MAG: hypothetical protein OXD36_09390 [Rhodobacter sp.]|nr:hypothetical protein [Rhodobacter sp.]